MTGLRCPVRSHRVFEAGPHASSEATILTLLLALIVLGIGAKDLQDRRPGRPRPFPHQ